MLWIFASLLFFIIVFRVYLWITNQHVHFHSQNLSDGKLPMWRYGRCWWYISRNDGSTRYPPPTIHPTWYLFSRDNSLGLGFDIAGDEFDFNFHIGLPWLCSLHLQLSGLPIFDRLFNGLRMGYGCDTSVKFFDNAVWIHVAHNDTWGSKFLHLKYLPSWISIVKAVGYSKYPGVGFYVSLHYLDMLLGRYRHQVVRLWAEPVYAEIPIEPDNSLGFHYFGTFMAEQRTWCRERFPWIKRIHRYVDIAVEKPPMHSGKGENS